ncbi:MAG TPA: AMP-binding protein [Rhizomicrobium sp.]|jgi:acyl-CoA synthetase (AMP-forming)/AMP-acid ligase II|nr:AMP-binding protein [Rhizomicrobium sp.]
MLHERIAEQAIQEPSRVEQIISRHARNSPTRPALIEDHQSWTYGELHQAVVVTAEWLKQSGVRPRDRLMIVCENCCAAVALYFASTTIGAWPVLVNARLSAPEIDQIDAHCGSRRMVFTASASARAKAHAERLGAAQSDPAALGLMLGPPNESVAPEPQGEDASQSDVAAIIYTTGTTGRPKGVMLTHANLLFVARATAEARRLNANDEVYATLPISHTLGLSGVLLAVLLSGARIHVPARFDPKWTLAALAMQNISVLIGTPAMYTLLVDYAKRKGKGPIDAPSLRLISSAGAPLDAATKTDVEAAFGQALHNGYGISECGPSITITSLDAPRTDCSVGRLLPGIEAKLLDENGSFGHDTGELWVRSPGMMKGYYRSPEETAAVIDSVGWFRTGDLARRDADENFFIVGRARELIIRFGFNVYPAEIEAVLNTHPAVFQSAVVGKQAGSSEEIVAFVQRADGAGATAEEIANYVASRLAPQKRPTEIRLLPTMPMSANGKILKAELARMCAGGQGV